MQLQRGFDFKDLITEDKLHETYKVEFRKLQKEEDNLKKFFLYKGFDLHEKYRFDCDKLGGVYLAKSYLEEKSNLNHFDCDTLNSFWKTCKWLIEESIKEYLNAQKYDYNEIKFCYEYIMIEDGFNDKKLFFKDFDFNILENFFSNEFNYNKTLKNYIHAYIKAKDTKRNDTLLQEKFLWLAQNSNTIRYLIRYAVMKRINSYSKYSENQFIKEFDKFARLTHNIGNFILFPKGYNIARTKFTDDYVDLTLINLQEVLGVNGLKGFVKDRHLEMYLKDNKPILFWEGHSFKSTKPKSFDDVYNFLTKVNRLIEERERLILDRIELKTGISNKLIELNKF